MELFIPRKLKFKAWNTETKLLMRLNSIDCVRGELIKKGNVLLQFTGLYDKQGEEIYDMDILLKDSNKYIVRWQADQNRWSTAPLSDEKNEAPISKNFTAETIRLCSYFESAG